MTHKSYPFSADIVVRMNAATFLDCVDLDAETLFCFTPSGMRSAIAANKELGEAVTDMLRDMYRDDTSADLFDRRGFTVPMTNKTWAYRMLQIAKAALYDYAPHYDEQEEGYAEAVAGRIAAAAIKQAAERDRIETLRQVNLAAKAKAEAAEAERRAAFKPEEDDDDVGFLHSGEAEAVQLPARKEATPLDLYLSGLRSGRGEIARMLVGSAAITTANVNQSRRYWTEKNMRVIERVSGYKHGSITIKYYGEELRLSDIEVWMKLLQLVADQPLGTSATFNLRAFARALGKGVGSNTLKALKKVLARLKAATFYIHTSCPHFIANMKHYFPEDKAVQSATKDIAITFNMLSEYVEADDGAEFSVTVGRAVRALIGTRVSFWYDETVYAGLQGAYAKRLYLLYTSHKHCHPLRLQEIRDYFGCKMVDDGDLQKELKEALNQLVEARVIKDGWTYMNHPKRGWSYVVDKVKKESAPEAEQAPVAEEGAA